MKICVLGSGSKGNCTFVGSDRTRLLIDAGLSSRQTHLRLRSAGLPEESIDAICVSHEHSDHRSGLKTLQRHTGAELYANSATIEAIERDARLRGLPWKQFTTGSAFRIGDLDIEPFSVPHDSYDPVGFIIRHENDSIGIVTDMGIPTELIRNKLRNCRIIVLESNHDETLLRDSPRPWSLKKRIMSRQGHLSNQQAAELLSEISGPALKAVFLAHLSSDCNNPELALKTSVDALLAREMNHVKVLLTYADRASDMI